MAIDKPIRNITISGRIASGSTTLGKSLGEVLGWKHLEGGEVFWEEVREKLHLDSKDTDKRPDEEDEKFDESLKKMLATQEHLIIETKLAGFNAQKINDVYKILVICNDEKGNDQTQIRIDRLVNREGISIEDAKREVLERENNDMQKWRKLYGNNDPNWSFYDDGYYDLVINSFNHDKKESLEMAMENLPISI